MKKYIAILLLALSTSLCALAQQTVTVTGTVTDENNEPLIGANVTVRDVPGLGAITDINGRYTITMEPFNRLIFSYIGYDRIEVLVKEQRVVNVVMKEADASILNEVVVTGLGTQRKLTVTGAVTNVDVEELQHFSTSNLSNALAGQVPGLFTMQTSGQPGKSTSEFWIRGISTFGASQSALILVDGFERDNLDDLNIEDIASFTVLKDASATAIYGTKGANGVVLITTKRGQAGKIHIDAKVETSYNTRTITPEFVDGVTYANLLNEALVTRNQSRYYQPEEIELIRTQMDPDLYPNVDWKDLILKDGAWSYRANLNMSGGGNTARYYVSASYVEDQGMYKTDETLRNDYDTNANYKRWNYTMNIDIDITKTTLLKLGVQGSLDKRNSPGLGDDDLWGELFGYNAIASPIFYSNGYTPAVGRNQNQMNPWVAATQTGYNEEWNNKFNGTIALEQDLKFITSGLKFTGRFGFGTSNYNYINRRRKPDMYIVNGRNQETGELIFDKMQDAVDMYVESGASGQRYESLELLLNWERDFKQHHLGATLRYTQDSRRETVDVGTDIKSTVAHRNLGLAGRATYNWAFRYFIDFNFGYTGSENFAPGHQFGFFPAFSMAWNIAEEPFIKKALPWMNMFKLRYSHGKVGNDYLTDSSGNEYRFPYLYTISTGADSYNWGFGDYGNSYSGTHYTQMASTYITWEISTKDDVGVDLSLFGDKFTATVDWYRDKRTGIFYQRSYLPAITGLESSPYANVGVILTKGWDGNFAYKQKFGKVDVTVRGNLSYYNSVVLEKDEQSQVYPYLYEAGYRVNQVKGLVALGLFEDYDDIRNSPTQQFGTVQPGDIKYKDVNGDGIVDDNDQVAIGTTSRPNLSYGVGASVNWNGFDINVHFQGVGKCSYLIYGKCVYAFSESTWGNIFKGMVDDRWIDADTAAELGLQANENPNASYPRLSYGGNSNNYRASTFWLRNGRYIRLKNIDIGYTFSKNIVSKMRLNSLRVYVTGQNLITWAPFKTWDPEMTDPRGESYPLSKSFTIGMTVSL